MEAMTIEAAPVKGKSETTAGLSEGDCMGFISDYGLQAQVTSKK